jgi:hypothetical protein
MKTKTGSLTCPDDGCHPGLALSYTLEGRVDLDEGEGRVTLSFRFMC